MIMLNHDMKFKMNWRGAFMKSKRLLSIIISIILTSLLISCNYINTSDSIEDSDEKMIKEFRSHQNYSSEELKSLGIKYLGEVDGFKIYFVPFKGSIGVRDGGSFTKENYTFSIESQIKVIGIKDNILYTMGELLHQTSINTEELYNILP